MRKTALVGHRLVLGEGVYEMVMREVERQIEAGCKIFTMGVHGEFDRLAFSACLCLKKRYPDVRIELVVTSPNFGKTNRRGELPDGVERVMFDVEEMHYKRRITWSNRKMIDGCDTLICYVDEAVYRSGAKAALRYARRRGLRVINLFRGVSSPQNV